MAEQPDSQMARGIPRLVVISALFVIGAFFIVGFPQSADLRALWLAGTFFDKADTGLVYRLSSSGFTMEPPDAWVARIVADGTITPVYPFIYPPIWAWVMSFVTDVILFEQFAIFAALANVALITGCFVLAWRISDKSVSKSAFVGIGLSFACLHYAFLLPLQEGQPQILVAFLTLLGIERARAGAPILGGAALAIAASIKVYPLVFALIWWAAGERRPVYSFACFGGALAALSVTVAGWPMHAAFLNELSSISQTVLLSLGNLSLDSLIAALTLPTSDMMRISTEATGGASFWFVADKAGLWQGISALVQIGTLILALVLARRTSLREPLMWPVLMIATAWVSPLTWIYHYMAALAFLPALVGRLPVGVAATFLILIALPASYPLAASGLTQEIPPWAMVLASNAAMLFAVIAFSIAMVRGQDRLHPPATSL